MQEELPDICNITFVLFLVLVFVQPFQLVHYNIFPPTLAFVSELFDSSLVAGMTSKEENCLNYAK